ncbi:MAG: phosphohexomutase domain-containing protein [Planctomycetota bacterium]
MSTTSNDALLDQAEQGIQGYLNAQRDAGAIAGTYYDAAVAHTMPNLRRWITADVLDTISPNLRTGLRTAISEGRWEELTNAFSRDVAFGTGGIREKMGPTRDVVLQLKEHGVDAPIVKGPNTINNVIYLLTSAGTAKFGRERTPALSKVVIGFDSRVRGSDFARLIAQLFLAYDYTVYIFDEACLYPSVTFALPTLRADMGVFISASHNDFRYNGYKLSCMNGSQFDPAERDSLYNDYIRKVDFTDIKLTPFADAPEEKIWFLGGTKPAAPRAIESGEHAGLPLADPLPGEDETYAGRPHRIIDLHTMHCDHVKSFLLRGDEIRQAARPLSIGYSAFNGSGRKAVPRLLEEVGFKNVRRIMKLDALDGMFPAFCSDPGQEQQPDPGDWRAGDVAVDAFKEEYGDAWDEVDLIVGTDPDADRCGVIVKVPEHQRDAYPHPGTGEARDYSLISADEAWSLILWYRLTHEVETYGSVRDADKKFIVLSHTTTDLLPKIARKFGLGVLKTWVGFAQLAAGTRAIWDLSMGQDTEGLTENGILPVYDEGRRHPGEIKSNRTFHSWEAMEGNTRSINIAALEQSNGFSMLGGVPADDRSLGKDGHVRDKDGTFAAVLVAELASYAKQQGTNLIDLLDEKIYLDRDIGLYVTHYEPDPLDGEYEGLAGYTKKRGILDRAEDLFSKVESQPFELGELQVMSATAYRTGKYDRVNWEGFPDEGYRFFFDASRRSHLTIRPSGTSNALRFHVQLYGGTPSKSELMARKADMRAQSAQIVRDIRRMIGAE